MYFYKRIWLKISIRGARKINEYTTDNGYF